MAIIPQDQGGSRPGEIRMLANEEVPTGWLMCDGSLLSREQYPDLFKHIGHTYGYDSSQGLDFFYIPDYRGVFLRGWAKGSLDDPDRNSRGARQSNGIIGDRVGSYQGHELKSHSHSVAYDTTSGNNRSNWRLEATGSRGNYLGSYGGNETRPRNMTVMYIIKY